MSAGHVFSERIQSFVIPACQHFLETVHNERHVHFDFGGLADTVQPPNSLLEKFRIDWKIEQDQMVSKLKVAAFAANFRTEQNVRTTFFGEPCGIAIALNQRQ